MKSKKFLNKDLKELFKDELKILVNEKVRFMIIKIGILRKF